MSRDTDIADVAAKLDALLDELRSNVAALQALLIRAPEVAPVDPDPVG